MEIDEKLLGEMYDLVQKEAIRSVLMRYARGVDRCDRELIRSVYHEDAWDDHGPFKGTGFDFADSPYRYSDANRIGHHAISTNIIELDGDVAYSESFYIFHGIRAEPDGDIAVETAGRYVDRFEKRDGEWKIAYRTTTLDWCREYPLIGEWKDAGAYVRPRRYRDDICYQPEQLVRPNGS